MITQNPSAGASLRPGDQVEVVFNDHRSTKSKRLSPKSPVDRRWRSTQSKRVHRPDHQTRGHRPPWLMLYPSMRKTLPIRDPGRLPSGTVIGSADVSQQPVPFSSPSEPSTIRSTCQHARLALQEKRVIPPRCTRTLPWSVNSTFLSYFSPQRHLI